MSTRYRKIIVRETRERVAYIKVESHSVPDDEVKRRLQSVKHKKWREKLMQPATHGTLEVKPTPPDPAEHFGYYDMSEEEEAP